MTAPWEQYASAAAPTDGPWSAYAKPVVMPTAPPVTRQELVGDAPAQSQPQQPKAEWTAGNVARWMFDPYRKLANVVTEVPVSIASGLAGMVAGNVVGAGKEILTGDFGKGTGEATAKKVSEAMTYRPRDPASIAALEGIGSVLKDSKLEGVPVTGGVSRLPEAASQAAQYAKAATGLAAAQRAEKAAKVSRLDAPKNEAVVKAHEAGYVLPPTIVKEGGMRSAMESLGGRENVASHASLQNQAITNAKVRKTLGIPEDMPLDEKAFATVAARTNVPYEKISAIPAMGVDDAFAKDLSRINNFDGMQPSVQAIIKKSGEADALMGHLNSLSNVSGEEAVRLMGELRSKANMVGQTASANEKALASVQKSAANAIENLVERNLGANPQYAGLLDEFRNARTTKAQMHMIRKNTNMNTGNVDAAALASQVGKGKYVTGELKDIADIAGHFKKAFRTPEQIGQTAQTMTMLTSGLFGAAGATVGGPVGALVGPAAWHMTRAGARKAALGPRMQRSLLPNDARPLRERMGYGQTATEVPPTISSNLPTPYQYRGDINPPESYRPNWTPGSGYGPVVDTAPQRPSGLLGFEGEDFSRMAKQREAFDQRMTSQSAIEGEVLPRDPNWTTPKRGLLGDLTERTQLDFRSNLLSKSPKEQKLLVDAELVSHRKAMAQAEAEYASWAKKSADDFAAMKNESANSPRVMSDKERRWDRITKREAKRRMEMQQGMRAMKDKEAELIALQDMIASGRPLTKKSQGPKTRSAQRGLLDTGE